MQLQPSEAQKALKPCEEKPEATAVGPECEAVAAEGPEPLADPLTLLRFYRRLRMSAWGRELRGEEERGGGENPDLDRSGTFDGFWFELATISAESVSGSSVGGTHSNNPGPAVCLNAFGNPNARIRAVWMVWLIE